MDNLWYKDAIIYELHVKSFFDKDNDGVGDFQGLIDKLDYLQDLGINTIWLLPFFESPQKDDGYDIQNYYQINKDYGSLRDFKKFMKEAKKRNLKVMVELVVNHTSDQHFWFQSAIKQGKKSKFWNYYIWNDDPNKFKETRIIFSDIETSNWAWEPNVKKFYWHRFFSHQPDLNHNNPDVVRKVKKILAYWADLGVDGFRLDAIPYLCVRDGTNNENLPETHAVIKEWRKFLDENYPNCAFLAEANQWPEDVVEYFGNNDECHMAYHFPLMPRIYLALKKESRKPIVEIMQRTPNIPTECQWTIFLRNHDELTLEMVTDEERDYMYKEYAKHPKMKLNMGIRRRLAPLLDNDRKVIELLNSLLFSMPGTPIIYYGDEIGMGDNIFLGDRNGVRTPMQWTPGRNAGFSKANPHQLCFPVIMDPVYSYESINVEAQSTQPSSLLNFMKKIISVRKRHKSFSRGDITFLTPKNNKILAYIRNYENEKILCIVNLAKTPEFVELDLSEYAGNDLVELFHQTVFPEITEQKYFFTMQGHSFFWFEIKNNSN